MQDLKNNPQSERELIDYALEYAEFGFKVVPLYPAYKGHCFCLRKNKCVCAGKHPWLEQWQNEASSNPEKIREWWGRTGKSNIGIATGRASGIVVLDIDGPKGEAEMLGFDRQLPFAPKNITGNGLHYLFKYPDEYDIPNVVGLLPGVDIKSNGGQIVVPPSFHAKTGKNYKWEVSPFDFGEFPDLPGWLLDKILTYNAAKISAVPEVIGTAASYKGSVTPYVQKALADEALAVSSAAEGTRNITLSKAALKLGNYVGGGELSETTARTELTNAGLQAGLDLHEINSVLRTAIPKGKLTPKNTPKTAAVFLDLEEAHTDQKKTYRHADVDVDTGEVKDGETTAPALDLLQYEGNDEGNARAFMALYGDMFLYSRQYGWLCHNGKFWATDKAESLLDKYMVQSLEERHFLAYKNYKNCALSPAISKATALNQGRVSALKERLAPKLETLAEEFDNNPDLLNCNNGVINLRTGTLTHHDNKQRFTYATKINYNPARHSKEWGDFLEQVVGDYDKIKDYLQKAVGYSLTGHTSEECLFYIYGPTRSGKGTFSEVLLAMLGERLATEVDFNTFTAKREGDSNNFDLAPLKPARLIIASESQRYQSLNPAKIKSLTGGNDIRCSFKHKDHFSYRPQFKMWMSSNWPANGDVDDGALWYRLRVIDFPNTFQGREDKGLKNKLKSEEVLEGVLAWAVAGAIAWYASDSGLITPEIVSQTTQKQRDEGDFIQAWLAECADSEDATVWTAQSDIIRSYQKWCEENGVEAKKSRSLSTSLKTKGYLVNVLKRERGSTPARGVQGLRLV